MPTGSGVVFDVDDTLYLERDYVASGFAALEPLVRQRWGVPGFDTVAWQLFLGGHRGTTIDAALQRLGVRPTPDGIADLVTAYRAHHPRISLLPDAREALEQLRGEGVPVAFLSDGPERSQAAKVAALGLDRYASHTVLTGAYRDGRFGKPHPRGYQEIAARLGCARLAYVADNPAKDFAAPRRLGWSTVRIRRAGGLHHDAPHGDDVDTTLANLDSLRAALAW
ncbi:MAG TPA: HAD family hydrolase [Rugosimonospora sp.]|nr:HAD family hydrolase [Rugosimonospora sp.]